MDTLIKQRKLKFKFVKVKTQFEKAKCQFTTDIRFLHGFEKLVLGWMFINLRVHWWSHKFCWLDDSVVIHVDPL